MTTDICLVCLLVSHLIILLHFTMSMLIVSVSLLVYSVIYQRVCFNLWKFISMIVLLHDLVGNYAFISI